MPLRTKNLDCDSRAVFINWRGFREEPQETRYVSCPFRERIKERGLCSLTEQVKERLDQSVRTYKALCSVLQRYNQIQFLAVEAGLEVGRTER